MKQLLLICAVVALVGGCVSTPVVITNPDVEAAIRAAAKKPTGELTQADFEKVTKLNLEHKKLTSVKGLEKLTQLKALDLSGNQLTDVTGLEKLTKLTELDLYSNQLTNVNGLEKLTQLEGLWLEDNPALTKEQIIELHKALPNCRIHSHDFK